MNELATEVAIIGTGITGIATAYYLTTRHNITDILLIDAGQPMAFTSAQSGENYRNWWPHPTMVAFTNRSIDLMEEIALASDNRISMNRRGYALATRATNIDEMLEQLHSGLGESANRLLRFHDAADSLTYQPPISADWKTAPDGVDVLQDPALIRSSFPGYDHTLDTVIHIRRGGDISGQQLGMHMLEVIRARGGKRITGTVESISRADDFTLCLSSIDRIMDDGISVVRTEKIINAAGPFADKIAQMVGVDLPVYNTLQQKIAFEDSSRAIPRNMPFSIDLDAQLIDWTTEERNLLLQDTELSWLSREMPGSIHCRPDGGDKGTWVKLGWAYNEKPEPACWTPNLNDHYPEIVLRGAARLNPSLKTYYDKMPHNMHHYGGWYTRTTENWPLIGPMQSDDFFMNCAYSGFGTMAACAGGELCAAWVAESELPEYATELSTARYDDAALMERLFASNKGVL